MCFTRGDAVAVESILCGHFDTFPQCLLLRFFGVQSSSEPASSLLVHLGTRSNAINRHEEQLLGPNLAEQMLDVVEDSDEHLLLGHAKRRRIGVFVGTIVYDTVHIEVSRRKLGAATMSTCAGLRNLQRLSNSGMRFSAMS